MKQGEQSQTCLAVFAGSDDGLVEFVPSAPLSRILAEHRTLHKYLAQTQADPQGEGDAEHSTNIHCSYAAVVMTS